MSRAISIYGAHRDCRFTLPDLHRFSNEKDESLPGTVVGSQRRGARVKGFFLCRKAGLADLPALPSDGSSLKTILPELPALAGSY